MTKNKVMRTIPSEVTFARIQVIAFCQKHCSLNH